MSILFDQVNNHIKEAMKGKEEKRLSTLRMLLASLKNKKIDLGVGKELTDTDVLMVIKSEIKKRKDSIEAYENGGRNDLADSEKEEISILEKYMPEQMSVEELEKIVKDTISEVGAKGAADFGKVMGVVMSKAKGQADGNVVSAMVKKNLN